MENVLLTSWNWAVLSDFATYKPVALPEVWAENIEEGGGGGKKTM